MKFLEKAHKIALRHQQMAKDNLYFFEKKKEWSKIKDKLLDGYLVPYFQKLLSTNRPICYVDCFAGKGKFEDGEDGSPLIALKARDFCIRNSQKLKNKYGAIDAYFIESNRAWVEELKKNIVEQYSTYGEPHIVHGKYEDVIKHILQGRRDQNVFLYLDPYGIKPLDFALFKEFQTYNFGTFEILVNFNSSGFFRNACKVMKVEMRSDDEPEEGTEDSDGNDATEEMLTSVANGDYWKEIVRGSQVGKFSGSQARKLSGFRADKQISAAYKQQLREMFKYVIDMTIREKSEYIPKYRMIHACNHEDGCFLMAKNMQKRTNELVMYVQHDEQLPFPSISHSTEGDYFTKDEIEEKARELLRELKLPCKRKEFLTKFVNKNGVICDFKTMYSILKEMGVKLDGKESEWRILGVGNLENRS